MEENHITKKTNTKKMEKKLQRDTQNKVIGGVCSGLANYFDIDVAIVRVLFAIALLCFSTGFWIYLILWIVMPAGIATNDEATYVVAPDGSVTQPQNKGSMTAGLILIGIGALGLLHRFVPQISWSTAWPIMIILLGVYLIVPRQEKKS